MSKGPPPAYVPESDTRPLLVTEQYPQPHGPSPFGIIHAHHTVVVASQRAVYGSDDLSWVGTDEMIYFSICIMFLCGLVPGTVALFLSLQARTKKELGQIGEAKRYTTASVLCSMSSMVLGVVIIVVISMYYAIRSDSI